VDHAAPTENVARKAKKSSCGKRAAGSGHPSNRPPAGPEGVRQPPRRGSRRSRTLARAGRRYQGRAMRLDPECGRLGGAHGRADRERRHSCSAGTVVGGRMLQRRAFVVTLRRLLQGGSVRCCGRARPLSRRARRHGERRCRSRAVCRSNTDDVVKTTWMLRGKACARPHRSPGKVRRRKRRALRRGGGPPGRPGEARMAPSIR